MNIGEDFARRLNLVPGPDSDIQDWDGELKIFNDADEVIISATTDNGRMTTHNGYIEIDIPASVTGDINLTGLSRTGTLSEPANNDEIPYSATGKLARYFVRVTSPGGVITRFLDGQFVIAE
jgi:hypothetical protein